MSLSEYREIPPGAAYPHVPDDQLAGSFVIKLRFFLQGRKYGRRVLLDGETQGGGYGYEVAGEIAQHDANQVGTIVEFELTTYSRTTMPNGKPAAAAVTSWEAVIPRKSWPYRPLPADFSRHVVEALAAGNSEEWRTATLDAWQKGSRDLWLVDEDGATTRPPWLGSTPYPGNPSDPTSDAWRFGVDRTLTDEQHEELREALAAGIEADSGTGGRYAHCWDAVAGEDEPVPFVPVHEPKPPVGRDALAEPPTARPNPFDVPVGEPKPAIAQPDPSDVPVNVDALGEPVIMGNTLYLGVGETLSIPLSDGRKMHIAVVADGELQHNTVEGGDQSVIMPAGSSFSIGSGEDADDELGIVAGTTAAAAKEGWRAWLTGEADQPY